MGAGSCPAGHAPAGADAGVSSGPPRPTTYPRAIQFLAQQRGFPIDDAGRYIDVHPVDQRVAMKLTFVAGSLGSNQEIGHKLRSIPYTTAATVPAEVRDAVALALADELAAGEIKILEIVTEAVSLARIAVVVSYVNLVTRQQMRAEASVGGWRWRTSPTCRASWWCSRAISTATATCSIKIRNPPADTGPGNQPYIDASAHADSSVGLYHDAQLIGDATNTKTARGTWLDRRLDAAGLSRDPATGASGFVIAQASIGGGTIQKDDELKELNSGTRYKVLVTGLYQNGSLVPVEGIDTGSETNLAPGTVLVWSAPRPGIGPRATVFQQEDGTGLSGGHPAESDEDCQAKLDDAAKNPPAAGNDAEYQRVIEKTPGIAVQKGFTFPCIKGASTMGACFTLRPPAPGGSRIPNAAQIAQVLANLIATEASDDQIFLAQLLESLVSIVYRVSWSRRAPTWVDIAPWPTFVTGLTLVTNSITPTPTSCQLQGTTSQPDPVVGQTIGLYDRTAQTFRRKRIAAVSINSAGLNWNLTFDGTNQASDITYVPVVGQIASPWSDSLQQVVSPTLAYVDGFGPGEQVSSFPDPGLRHRRQPEAPEQWPNTVTNRITDPLFGLSAVQDVALAAPTVPYATPVGAPGTLSYLLTLGDLAVYPQ